MKSITTLGLAVFAAVLQAGAAQVSPGRIDAPDLTPLKDLKRLKGEPVRLVSGGKAVLPIVHTPDRATAGAARFLADIIAEMTGVKPQVMVERENDRRRPPWTNAPAIFVGDTLAVRKAGLGAKEDRPRFGVEAETFRVLVKDGSVYLIGNKPQYAVADFAERLLGARQYWPVENGGRSVIRTAELAVPCVDWSDLPVFDHRDLWPYEGREWVRLWKVGSSHPVKHTVHAPAHWVSDKKFDYINKRPEIFALADNGTRGGMPLLCYGNPKTLETYLERIDMEIRGEAKSDGIVDVATKTITVSQWDVSVFCSCEHCKAIKAKSGMPADSFSDVLWSHFTKKLAGIAKKRYPGYTVSILPYQNTCDIPPALDYTKEGNVEVFLCTMPGLALLKDAKTRDHEEGLIREWRRRTGRKVLNWHYICWPCIFTQAPYVFGETIQGHYKRLRNDISGSFLNGDYDVRRLCVSAYVWLKCLWNPDFDLQAVYDGFAERMFGPAARPMREIVRMQEAGWNRQWDIPRISNKNVYGVSYPRKEVLRMQELFAEAKKLANGDELLLKRIAYYEGGFAQFFAESEEYASGVAFPPVMMQKVSQDPVIDGRLDEADWKRAEPRAFVKARYAKGEKTPRPAETATELRAIWSPEGVTLGIRCDEPEMANLCDDGPVGNYWANDAIDTFLDFGGETGVTAHLMLNASGKLEAGIENTDGTSRAWKDERVKYAVFKGKDFWSLELYLPYAAMEGKFPSLQRPTTSGGMFWTGNLSRLRRADKYHSIMERTNRWVKEHTRLGTRGSGWNRNSDAFSKFIFKEQ